MDDRTRKALIALLPRLRRFALGLTRNAAEADDLVQSACEKGIRRINQWEPGTRLDSWMYRIIQTTHIDNLRSRKRRETHLEVVHDADAMPEGVFDGEAAQESKLTFKAVRNAILQLPDEQRVVIMLVCVDGHSYKEAADVLGIPMGTLTSRLGRGRMALTQILNGKNDTTENHTDNNAEPSVPQRPGMHV